MNDIISILFYQAYEFPYNGIFLYLTHKWDFKIIKLLQTQMTPRSNKSFLDFETQDSR